MAIEKVKMRIGKCKMKWEREHSMDRKGEGFGHRQRGVAWTQANAMSTSSKHCSI